MQIIPFRGYRFNPDRISNLEDVISLPYDQFKQHRDERFHDRHPYNIAHIIMNPKKRDDSLTNNQYTRSKKLLNQWLLDSVLLQDAEPSIYPYYQDFCLPNGNYTSRKGFVALGQVSDYSSRKVYPHESTMTKPKQDRLQLLRTTLVDSGLVFMLYSDPKGEIEKELDLLTSQNADMNAFGPEGILNRMWKVSKNEGITKIQEAMKCKSVIIADGHHRYEVAQQFHKETAHRLNQTPAWVNYGFKLMSFVRLESPAISIFPLHRVLRNMGGFEPSQFLQQLKAFFSIQPIPFNESNFANSLEILLEKLRQEQRAGRNAFGIYLPGLRHLALLTFRPNVAASFNWPSGKSKTWCKLDVSILQVVIFNELLGIGDQELAQAGYIEYVSDAKDAVNRVIRPPYQCAFLLNPTPVNQVQRVVESGNVLPQKSTHFHPKLMEGLVLAKHL